jgi:hypothetical protein
MPAAYHYEEIIRIAAVYAESVRNARMERVARLVKITGMLLQTKVYLFWIILTNKKYADPQPVSFNEAVSEAVKQGLIDSRSKSLSERKYAIRFTKRKSPKPFP